MRALGFILACQATGLLGALTTRSGLETWYQTLRKPSFAPPNWVFGPVWTTLYTMMGLAADRVADDPLCLRLFWLQLFLNGLWSFLFFGFRKPGWALVEIVLLWTAIAFCVHAFWPVDKLAAAFFWPYWAWVSFATILNFEFWRLNRC